MTGEEFTALVAHITALEADLAAAHRRIDELEFEASECRARETHREAMVQERVARLIEQGRRRRAEGERMLGG